MDSGCIRGCDWDSALLCYSISPLCAAGLLILCAPQDDTEGEQILSAIFSSRVSSTQHIIEHVSSLTLLTLFTPAGLDDIIRRSAT